MPVNTTQKQAKKLKVVRVRQYHYTKQTVNTFVRTRIDYIGGQSVFREEIICRIAINIRDEMVYQLEKAVQDDKFFLKLAHVT